MECVKIRPIFILIQEIQKKNHTFTEEVVASCFKKKSSKILTVLLYKNKKNYN